MVHHFYKHKVILDENMPSRTIFPRLNGLFDVKHIRDDLHNGGLPDPEVHKLAAKLQRIIITFNAKDFRDLALQSNETGVIGISSNLTSPQIDTKLTALLVKSSKKALPGKLTIITGETRSKKSEGS